MIARFNGRSRKKSTATSPTATNLPTVIPALPVPATITYGGWHPRTAMHMAEVYRFFTEGWSTLPLSEKKLTELHAALDLRSVSQEVGYLEYLRATTNSGIEIRYFEDGLFLLEVSSKQPQFAAESIKRYYTQSLAPALQYLYSLGSPLAEPTANPKRLPSVVISLSWPHPHHFEIDPGYGLVRTQVTSDDISVYKTDSYQFIITSRHGTSFMRDIVEMHVFFREYERHLETYLSAYRKIWSEVAQVRERRQVQPVQLPKFYRLLHKHQRTTTIAMGRMGQMSAHVQTRASLAEQLELGDHLHLLFHYRFEALEDSLHYLDKSWTMTQQYIDQSLSLLDTLQSRTMMQLLSSQRGILVVLTLSALLTWLSTVNIFTIDHSHAMAFAVVMMLCLVGAWLFSLATKYSEYRILPEESGGRAAKKSAKSPTKT